MIRRVAAALAAALMLLAALAAPALAAPADPASDPLRTLGGDSPLCAKPASPAARDSCEASGSVEHAYPLDRYRFDWHIDTGITKIDGNLASALQWLVSIVWQGVLWIANAILMVFQWAFSLDILGPAMQPLRETLERLHTTVLGQPWFLAALSLLGLWGLWNGIVRRRTSATVAGLASAVVMMAAALALIARPDATLGSATRLINDTKTGILAGVAGNRVSNGQGALEDASREIFNTIVLRPWCAVQFGDVDWCLERAPGDTLADTRADRWLRFEPGSRAREIEYRMLAEDDADADDEALRALIDSDELSEEEAKLLVASVGYAKSISEIDRGKIQMQEQDRTIFRAGLIGLVLAGVIGWALLLGWLAVQSLLQALMGLMLVLAAPIMLLAPAFGETGRRVFMRWATRLLATVVSGAIYALLLALTLAVAQVIGTLSIAGTFLAAWFLQMVFLWGIFTKRKQALAWLSGNTVPAAGGGKHSETLARKQNRERLHEQLVTRPVSAIASPVRTAVGAHRARAADKDGATQLLGAEQLAQRGRELLQTRYDAHHARLTTHDEAARKLPEMRRRRDKVDRQLQAPRLSDEQRGHLQAERGKLTGQIRALEPKLMPRAEEGVARKFIETADRNLVESGQRFSQSQVDVAVEGLRSEVTTGAGSAAAASAWRLATYRPGVPESELAKLPEAERTELYKRVDDDLERDRRLFAALPDSHRQDRVPAHRRRAATQVLQTELGSDAVLAVRSEQRAQRMAQEDGGPLHAVRAHRADRRALKRAGRAAVAAATGTVPSAPDPRHTASAPPPSVLRRRRATRDG